MAIKGIDHVSILAKKPEDVIKFYEDFLGFRLVLERSFPKLNMNIYNLKKGKDFIEIIQPTSEDIRMAEGIKHIAFLSDNIEEDFEYFKGKGAKLLHREIQRQEGVSFFFVKSPSGEFIEVIEYAEGGT